MHAMYVYAYAYMQCMSMHSRVRLRLRMRVHLRILERYRNASRRVREYAIIPHAQDVTLACA